MNDRPQKEAVKRAQVNNGTPRPGTTVRLETALQRAVASVRQMTRSQRRQSLINAGILTSEGKLAATYR